MVCCLSAAPFKTPENHSTYRKPISHRGFPHAGLHRRNRTGAFFAQWRPLSYNSTHASTSQDNSLINLAKTYHATLLAIALQTRHIVDTLNAAGHAVTSIYMSGGQAKNTELMQLFADVCDVPVVLPVDSDGAVVLGAAMLGRFAAEAHSRDKEAQAERLWDIMVSGILE